MKQKLSVKTHFTSTLDEEIEEKPRKRRKRMKELPNEGSSEDGKSVIALAQYLANAGLRLAQ